MKATYPIEELALFPRHQTRAAYKEATGKEAPEFNPNRRPKYWEDPSAANVGLRNVTYPLTIAVTDQSARMGSRSWRLSSFRSGMPAMEAATVNIPPDGTNIEGADVYEVGMPLKPLPSGHELFFQFGGLVAVKDVAAFAEQVEGFTAADRALIQAIAKKLGV